MMMRSVLARGLVGLLVVLGLAIASGCGEDEGIGRRYPVSGKVTYKGEPVPKGTVSFTPADSKIGRHAGGDIQPDGSYRLTTLTPGDGALPGKYLVSVAAQEVDTSATKNAVGGMYRVDIVAKAPRKYLVSRKYADPNQSGLTAEVKAETNTFDFHLAD
jgi:hypothetical protein